MSIRRQVPGPHPKKKRRAKFLRAHVLDLHINESSMTMASHNAGKRAGPSAARLISTKAHTCRWETHPLDVCSIQLKVASFHLFCIYSSPTQADK